MFPRSRSEWTVCDFFSSISHREIRHGTPPCNHPTSGWGQWMTKKGPQKKQQHAKHKHESWSFFVFLKTFSCRVFFFSLEKSHVLWPPWPQILAGDAAVSGGVLSSLGVSGGTEDAEFEKRVQDAENCWRVGPFQEMAWVFWWFGGGGVSQGVFFFCFFLRSVSFQFVGCVFFWGGCFNCF